MERSWKLGLENLIEAENGEMSRINATSNHQQDQKFLAGKEVGLNIISRGVKWEITEEKLVTSMQERRRAVNRLSIEIGDEIVRMSGKINRVVSITRDFLLKFENYDRIDPLSIEELGLKVVKK